MLDVRQFRPANALQTLRGLGARGRWSGPANGHKQTRRWTNTVTDLILRSTPRRLDGATLSSLVLIVAGSLLTIVSVSSLWSISAAGGLGMDHAYYRDLGTRWLIDGSYYLPHQLAGPYDITLMSDVLYPPSALLLFVPASILPAALWWAVPIAITLYVMTGWRPSRWGLTAMLLFLAWPRAIGALMFGNTDIWAMAGVTAGLRWGWPAALLILKPTLAPFGLLGMRHGSWWLAAASIAACGMATLPLWHDYATAMLNIRAGTDYSLGSLPILAVPLVAWLTRRNQVGQANPRFAFAQTAAATSDGRTARPPSS